MLKHMNRRKLMINIAVVVICGLIAISVPVLANHFSHTTNANTPVSLVSVPTNNHLLDAKAVWQLELRQGDRVIKTWDEIYQSIQAHHTTITYDSNNLQLTSYGLLLPDNKTTEGGYHSVVIYENYQCELKLG